VRRKGTEGKNRDLEQTEQRAIEEQESGERKEIKAQRGKKGLRADETQGNRGAGKK
jgi:hypothetical protein